VLEHTFVTFKFIVKDYFSSRYDLILPKSWNIDRINFKFLTDKMRLHHGEELNKLGRLSINFIKEEVDRSHSLIVKL
jgi:hypothetical protein